MTKILVPPGIGDIYWVLVKLQGFMAAHGIDKPEIWVDAPNDKKRSAEYVERIPFVTFGGYHETTKRIMPANAFKLKGRAERKGLGDPVRSEAYLVDGRHAFKDVEGFDWFISYNGSINAGRSLDEVDPEWPANWDFDMLETDSEHEYGRELRERIGGYVICAFFDAGFYRKWLGELPPSEIYRMLSIIHDTTGSKILLTGASWDDSKVNRELLDLDKDHGRIISLIGQTTLDQYFGALRYSSGCIGFPAGNTMMGGIIGKPTCLIWNDFFNRGMHYNAMPPNNPKYMVANSKDGADSISSKYVSLLEKFSV